MSDIQERAEAFIATQELFNNLDRNQIPALAGLLEPTEFKAGDIVLREGQNSDRLYFIEAGKVDIVKMSRTEGETFVICTLCDGQVFGDMSFLDNRLVSATIMAMEPVTVWTLSRRLLEQTAELRDVYNQILRNLATINVDRLRSQNEAHVESLHAQLESSRLRNEAAQFLILIVIIFGIQNFAAVMIKNFNINTDNPLYEWGMLILFLAPSLYFARRFGYTWASMGLTLANWRRSLRDAGLIAIPLIGGGILGKWAFIRMGILAAEKPFFDLRLISDIPEEFVLYLMHATLQELGSRGIVQGSLVRFFGAEKGVRAVLVVSLMFAILHLHLGLAFVGMVFVGSLFFGMLYLRHGTLIGVIIVHYILGILMQFLGFM